MLRLNPCSTDHGPRPKRGWRKTIRCRSSVLWEQQYYGQFFEYKHNRQNGLITFYRVDDRSHRGDGVSFLIQCSGAICVLHSFNFQVNLLPALLLGGLLLLGLPLLLSLFPGNVFPYLYFVLSEVDSEKSHGYGSLLIRWLPPYQLSHKSFNL